LREFRRIGGKLLRKSTAVVHPKEPAMHFCISLVYSALTCGALHRHDILHGGLYFIAALVYYVAAVTPHRG